jgi:NAD(P)H-hydrate epimerase
MKILTGRQMKELDRMAIEEYAIPSATLMENAGRSIVEVMTEAIDELQDAHVVVVSGKGNNGGDGFVVARYLINMGVSVETFMMGNPMEASEETRQQAQMLEKSGHEITYLTEEKHFDTLLEQLESADIVVDALLGIGVKGAVRSPMDKIIQWVNDSNVLIVSVDMPSGIDADNGCIYEELDSNYGSKLASKKELNAALDQLDDQVRSIIEMRYGLDDGATHSLQDVADQLKISKDQVRQIEMSTVARFRKPIVMLLYAASLQPEARKFLNLGAAIEADLTITIEYPKLGLFLHPGSEYTGAIVVTEIGYPSDLKNSFESNLALIDKDDVLEWLPQRNPQSHKGSNGRILMIAGSEGMSGAAILSSEATLRSGAGLVYMGFPESMSQIIETSVFEAIKIPLPEKDGALTATALGEIQTAIEEHRIDVIAIGPGLSQSGEIKELIQQLLPTTTVPIVLDADGLNALANESGLKLLKEIKVPVVLTPHPGELSRLIGKEILEIEENRVEIANQVAAELGVTLVLKGVPTVVATPGGETYINSTGNSGLATGGSGDVLTGLIAGLIGQGMAVDKAATAGVFIHGLIADRLEPELGQRAMLPRDLLAKMPEVMRELE